MKIAVVGANGKMGKLVSSALANEFEVIEIDIGDDLNLANESKLIIDFSTGKNSASTARFCRKHKIPLIIGATGQNEDEINEIIETSKVIPVVKAGNFSLGISLLKSMCSKFLCVNSENIIILERHHKNKVDAPSGTALELEKDLRCKGSSNISTHAIRGGAEIGTHEIDFYFGDELMSVTHKAFSRMAFVRGVLLSVDFIKNCSDAKLYTFDDVVMQYF